MPYGYTGQNLINQVTLITPNLPETEVLTGIKIKNKRDMIVAGKELIKLGKHSFKEIFSW